MPVDANRLSMQGRRQTLVDEESRLLRGLNEGYRTWALRNHRIQQLLESLQCNDLLEPYPCIDKRLQQLKSMTVGQGVDEHGGNFEKIGTDPLMNLLQDCEAAISKLELVSAKLQPDHMEHEAGGDDAGQPGRDIEQFEDALRRLEDEESETYGRKFDAEIDLEHYEQVVLSEWQDKKRKAEFWNRRHAVTSGVRHAMLAVKDRHQKRSTTHGDTAVEAPSALATGWRLASQELDLQQLGAETGPLAEPKDEDATTDNTTAMHSLSDVLAEGVVDPAEREEILKREHEGSSGHPHTCRACHFQGGLCWKGLACSFCHLCPKPKRKSKHQRDVDKRRQERYKQVKDEIGIDCLGELTKIDERRRQFMTSSEELKKRVKRAFQTSGVNREELIDDVRKVVTEMSTTIDKYHDMVPDMLVPEHDSEPESMGAAASSAGVGMADSLAHSGDRRAHQMVEGLSARQEHSDMSTTDWAQTLAFPHSKGHSWDSQFNPPWHSGESGSMGLRPDFQHGWFAGH